MQAFLPVRLSALLLLAVSLAFGIGSFRLGLWSQGIPGPGLTSFIGSLLLVPLSLRLLRAPVEGEDGEPLSVSALTGAIVFCLYVVALQFVGFALSTFVFLVVWARVLYRQTLTMSSFSAFGMCVAIGVVFALLLSVPIQIWPEWR